jgi:hypothetical protein
MLQAWGALNDVAPSAIASSPAETNEAREGRVRDEYASALALHAACDFPRARAAYAALAADLAADTLPSAETALPGPVVRGERRARKRPRDSNAASPHQLPTPEWLRSVRYAVQRNLGDLLCEGENRWADGLAAYAAALDHDSRDVVVWMRAGRAAVACGRLHVARRAFEQALRIRPGHWLCVKDYRRVLAAIGDADEDVSRGPNVDSASDDASLIEDALVTREREMREERKLAATARSARVESVAINEATWMALVDELAGVLKRRLSDSSPNAVSVGAPIEVKLDLRRHPKVESMPSLGVSVGRPLQENDANSVILIERDADVVPGAGAMDPSHHLHDTEANRIKPKEIRKSKRQADIGRERDACAASTTDRDALLDWGLTAKMLALIPNVSITPSQGVVEDCDGQSSPPLSDDVTRDGSSEWRGRSSAGELSTNVAKTAWNQVCSEVCEEEDVVELVESLAGEQNGGPIDVLCRILDTLIDRSSVQYMPHIARAWLCVQPHHSGIAPGTAIQTSFVIDSLLSSGDKTGKIKQACYREAHRLVAVAGVLRGIAGDDDRSERESLILSVRLLWLGCLLAERTGDMQRARVDVQACFDSLCRLLNMGGEDILSHAAGPLLAGRSIVDALAMVRATGAEFHTVGVLRDARALTARAKKNKDPALASKAAAMLAPAVNRIVADLRFNSPPSTPMTRDSLPLPGSKARSIMDAQLAAFMNACVVCSDDAGELVCHATMITIMLHDHGCLEAMELAARSDGDSLYPVAVTGIADVDGSHQNKDCTAVHKSASQRSEIASSLRKCVLVVKKISSTGDVHLTLPTGISGWSSAQAMCVAAKTIVATADMFQSRIPPLEVSTSAPYELSATQKNQRLAFTRAMLGFSRCIGFVLRTPGVAEPSEGVTEKMLTTLAFTLRVLASRGCVREDGTSAALIRLYLESLTARLRQLALNSCKKHTRVVLDDENSCSRTEADESRGINDAGGDIRPVHDDNNNYDAMVADGSVDSEDKMEASKDFHRCGVVEQPDSLSRSWGFVSVVRAELAQCYRCLFKIVDLEASAASRNECRRWLLDGCLLNRQLHGSSHTDIVAEKATMDVEACRGVYSFYRKRLLDGLGWWREGKQLRPARSVVEDVIHALPVEPPAGVPCLAPTALDTVISLALDGGGTDAVAFLKETWKDSLTKANADMSDSQNSVTTEQLSRMYYEVCVLHVIVNMAVHDAEYKKQKSVERRKMPKEAVERLINAASNDCILAVRLRPWSSSTWVLFGRVFLEVADVALDEREYMSSTFGMCRTEDLSSGDLLDPLVAVLGRAEGCFQLAEALAKEEWTVSACNLDMNQINAEAFDGRIDPANRELGSDGNLFGQFGLVDRSAPGSSRLLRAAAHFGLAAVLSMKLREERYRARHWKASTFVPRSLNRKSETFPDDVHVLVFESLKQLDRGMRLAFAGKAGSSTSSVLAKFPSAGTDSDRLSAFDPLRWYYMMQRAKLCRKRGDSPLEYLQLFADAVAENRRTRSEGNEAPDIEPFYKLHAIRMKLLLEQTDNDCPGLLQGLERHSYRSPADAEAEDAETGHDVSSAPRSSSRSSVARRRAIARDIASAMKHCRQQKSVRAFSEFFFKSVYTRALVTWNVLKDPREALVELQTMFRAEAAAKVADATGDNVHRGYFFTIWNYRLTDTGYELALETERKYLRWRDKLLGLYGALLVDVMDSRKLAGVISRLKRRQVDDMPVNGAVLDDFVTAHAQVSIKQTKIQVCEDKSDAVPTVALSENALFRVWDLYLETCRLQQAARRAKTFVEREEVSASRGICAVVASLRPWCLVPAACALHLEYQILQAAMEERRVDLAAVQGVPEDASKVSPALFVELAVTLAACVKKWPVEPKVAKLIERRIKAYAAGGTSAPKKRSKEGQDGGRTGTGGADTGNAAKVCE